MRCRQQNKMQLKKTFREVVLYLLHTMTGKHLLQTGLNDSTANEAVLTQTKVLMWIKRQCSLL